MLNAIRKRASSWFVRAFFIVLVASFAVWGIGDIFLGGQGNQVAATVGESEITVPEVANAFQDNVERLQDQLGTAIDREQALRLGVMDQALDQLIAQRLLDLGAADLGLRVADETLRRAVLDNPLFRTGDQFDRTRFENTLRASGLSEEAFLALLRRDTARSALLQSLAAPVEVPETLVDQLYRHRNERRGGQMLVVSPADIEDLPAPTEEELASFHEAHQAAFTAPEYRGLTFVTLQPEDIVDEVQVTEEELREEYELRLDEFTTPERRTVKQLLSSDEEAIRAAADWAAEGAEFATIAESNPKISLADLGEVARGELPAGLEEVAFGLEEGEVSKPVRSAFGWHLFRVEEVQPERVVPFEEARDELRRQLAEQRAVDELPALANALDDELAAGLPLEEAAASVGLDARTVEAVDARGRTPEGEPAAELPPWPEFLQTAFSTEPGEPTLLNEAGDGSYFVLRVDEVIEPRVKPLDEVREEVAAAWEAERRQELARERAEELRAQATEAGGKPLDELATAAGLEVRAIEPLRRVDPGAAQGINRDVVAALFATEPGRVADQVVPVGDGYAVVATGEVIPADPAADPEGVGRLRAELAAEMRDDLLRQYQAALRDRHPVDINPQALSGLL